MTFDFAQARSDIQSWIMNFVEQPNSSLGGWAPCPYARQARLQQKISIRMGLVPYFDLRSITHAVMQDLDVIILVYDPVRWPLEEFRADWQWAEQDWLQDRGFYVLEDHPSNTELVNGVCMNQGQYAMLFVQQRHKLEEAARQLHSKGYYDNWDAQYLQDLFRNREDPRA
jgi:hypothetical protein